MPPDDVGKALVSSTDILAERVRFLRAVRSEHAEPSTGLDRVEKHRHARSLGESHDRVRACEVLRVGSTQVSGSRERLDPVDRRAVVSAPCVLCTEQIHKQRVESPISSIRDEGCDVSHTKVADHRLRGISHDEEWPSALVDHVPPVSRHLQRKDERPCVSVGEATKCCGFTDSRPKSGIGRSAGDAASNEHSGPDRNHDPDHTEKSLPHQPTSPTRDYQSNRLLATVRANRQRQESSLGSPPWRPRVPTIADAGSTDGVYIHVIK